MTHVCPGRNNIDRPMRNTYGMFPTADLANSVRICNTKKSGIDHILRTTTIQLRTRTIDVVKLLGESFVVA